MFAGNTSNTKVLPVPRSLIDAAHLRDTLPQIALDLAEKALKDQRQSISMAAFG